MHACHTLRTYTYTAPHWDVLAAAIANRWVCSVRRMDLRLCRTRDGRYAQCLLLLCCDLSWSLAGVLMCVCACACAQRWFCFPRWWSPTWAQWWDRWQQVSRETRTGTTTTPDTGTYTGSGRCAPHTVHHGPQCATMLMLCGGVGVLGLCRGASHCRYYQLECAPQCPCRVVCLSCSAVSLVSLLVSHVCVPGV